MNSLGKGSLVIGALLGLLVVAGLGWAATGAPGAPTWMRSQMGMADAHVDDSHMAGGHGCHGCATRAGETPAGIDVAIRDVSFDPPTLRVRVGDTVVWQNLDPYSHTVTSDDGLFDSGFLGQGESWSIPFDEPGTYAYHCTPHASQRADGSWEGQTGLIVVET